MWTNLINSIESEDADIKHKISFINTLINVHGISLEVEDEIKLVKDTIKDSCGNATTRTEGLLLLYAVVHCSSTVYVDNWSQIVLGSLQIPDSLISREIPLKVVNRMLINFGRKPDYSDVFSKVIPDILPILLKPDDDKVYKLSCQTLAVCMRYVPKIAGTRVADIENLLLQELNNPYGEIIEAVGECFAALPMCVFYLQEKGSCGRVEYKDIWCNIATKILNTMHLVLNSLLGLTKDQEGYVDVSKLPVFDIPLEKTKNPLYLIDILKSFCQCLAKMMSSENLLIRLPVDALLVTLTRIFKMERVIIKNQNQDPRIAYLKLGYSQMLNGAYVVLEALILNFPVLEQSRNFVELMNMSFKAMKETSFSQSCVSQVKGSTWKVIDVWLKRFGPKGSYDIGNSTHILQELLEDIDILEKESNKSKQLKASMVEERNKKANKIFACTHALKVLKNLLETSNIYMEKDHLDAISNTILRISTTVVGHVSSTKPFPGPYSDEKCRKMLFDVLMCCTFYSDPLHSKCIVDAPSIFTCVLRDTSAKVRRIGHRFRKLSRYYLNPRKPPPDAVQYSHPSKLKNVPQPFIESVRSPWGAPIDWTNANGPSSDGQMDDNEVAGVHEENAYSDKMESEGDMMTIDEMEENHDYRRISKQSSQSMGEEESIDDSDIEPTYVSTDSNPHRIGLNDSSHINSFGMQSCVEQYANETRTERHTSEEVVPKLTNNVENNIEEHVSAFVEVTSAQKPSQVPMGNGEWRKKENTNESDEDESDMEEEEGDEEGEANEEVSDNAADEASDGKRSPDFDEERPSKRQKCIDEEGEDDVDEEVEDEDIPVNNQSSDEEENGVNNLPAVEQNAGSNSENLIDEESQDDMEDTGSRSPTIREMCGDFVLAEPAAPEIS